MKIELYVFDLDGVIYRMDDPIPGAVDAVHRLQQQGAGVYFLTNNSSKSRADYVKKLAGMDIHVPQEQIMTSAYALGRWLIEHDAVGKRAYVVGESGLRAELTEVGMELIEYSESASADFVVVGWDRSFTYRKLAEAQQLVMRGAKFIATNRDATYPDAGGKVLPGSGAIVASLVTCTGQEPTTIGKPEPYALELLLRLSGRTPQECLVIGDRIDTDIGIGKSVGARTALVLTGVHTEKDIASFPGLEPDEVWGDLSGLGR